MMRTILIGCGKWGTTVAGKLQAIGAGDVVAVCDTARTVVGRAAVDLGARYAVTNLADSEKLRRVGVDAAIIATPPAHRLAAVRAAIAAGVRVIRCEKPLAESMADAEAIVALCQEHDVDLTVGFTLLHDPMMDLAMQTAAAMGGCDRVSGIRVGAPPRHHLTPALDLGIHTTSVAAYMGADIDAIVCAHDPAGAVARTTVLHLTDGRGRIIVDEQTAHIVTPSGVITCPQQRDPLARELAAWTRGTHRGTPAVALAAQRHVADSIAAHQEAATS